ESARDGQAAELKQQLAERHGGLLARAQNLEPLLVQLRMSKREDELAMLDRAIALTDRGIRAMLRRLEPGQMEYEVWAEFDHALAKEGCLNPAFASIVASGKNIFCLHYMQPYDRIQDGDLVQVDVGAWVGGLCADISRVFPANGRFTASQAALYEVVRQCQETAFATIQPGSTLAAVNEACRQTARRGLLDAGLMQPDEAITDYFWHNVSHHLGLDVHDVANREALLQPGMVLTVEPGIYMPARKMGMRIEDDVVVTKDGCRVLSRQILREAAEIEALMAEARR
ncbi:MAG: M24 family metallopeptidase, partial [Eubacteriales bacterium]|nr:M24 family metallopeptidase [Eubacteriales bacterium]